MKAISGIYKGNIKNISGTPAANIKNYSGDPFPPGAVYGYSTGGTIDSGAQTANANRITYSTGVFAYNSASNQSTARNNAAGISDKKVYMYLIGGQDVTTYTDVGDRMLASTSVTSANTDSDLSQARTQTWAISDGETYGYIAGGTNGTVQTTADRLVFSTSVNSAHTDANLSSAKRSGQGTAGISDGVNYGYFPGGITAADVADTDRITFSTGVTADNSTSDLPATLSTSGSVSDGSTYGYTAGGGSFLKTAYRITFSTGVYAANANSNLATGRQRVGAVSEGKVYGYFIGGFTTLTPVTRSLINDRITFSTGVTAAYSTGNLPENIVGNSGVSDYAI